MTTPNPKPTADVIELVRELMDTYEKRDGRKTLGTNAINKTMDEKFKVEMTYHFPRIAEALTLACDALEEMANEQVEEKRGHLKIARPSRAAIKAMRTLSSIHSLHTP